MAPFVSKSRRRAECFPAALLADIIRVSLKVPDRLAPTPDKRGRRLPYRTLPCKRGREGPKPRCPGLRFNFAREEHDEKHYANGIDGRRRRRRAVGGLRRPRLYPGRRSECGAQSV